MARGFRQDASDGSRTRLGYEACAGLASVPAGLASVPSGLPNANIVALLQA